MGGSIQSIIQKYYPFEFVVNTTLSGSSGVGNYQLQLNPTYKYRYYVDWGDGVLSASTTDTNLIHTYPSGGTYTVKIYGRFDGIYNNGTAEAKKITSINSWGNIKWRIFNSSFYGCDSLTGTPITAPIFEKVGSVFSNSFRECTIFNGNIGYLDTSKSTNMTSMFQGAAAFNNGGSPSISGWTTSKVTNMSLMFQSASDFNQPIGSWNVSGVTNMSLMFSFASVFNNGGSPSISGWTTSKVTNMSSMFSSASDFNQPIGSWNVSGVTNMSSMFSFAVDFNQPIGSWNVSGVTNMSSMFFFASDFNNGGSPSISGWTTSKVTNMSSMFSFASDFNQPIGSWNVSGVTNMSSMFSSAVDFNQPIGSWNVSGVTNMASMFSSAVAFNNGGSPSISGWTTSKVTNMTNMFQSASAFNQPIGSWNVSGVTNMTNMLNNCGINNTNYNIILTGWTGWNGTGATKSVQSNVNFGANGRQYSTGTTAQAARLYLITGKTWTITGDIGV